MIEFVKGMIDHIGPEAVIVDVNGVGYQLNCPNPYVYEQRRGEPVKIYTYHYVREDLIALFGFQTREEKALFTKLLSVSGIGPKGALAILASGQPDQVVTAIEQENETFLTKFPGVGKKTARQMILDLKGKLTDQVLPMQKELVSKTYSPQLDEALEALKVLGYGSKEIDRVAPKLAEQQQTSDQYVKQALQMLLNGR